MKIKTLLSLLVCCSLVISCGSGGDNRASVAPQGIDDLVITLANTASFEFLADAVQNTPGSETGTFIYTQNTATVSNFIDITGVTSAFAWPTQLTFNRYTYTQLGESSGTVSFFGTPDFIGGNIFGAVTQATPASFNILFASNGSTITSLETVFDFISASSIQTGTFASTITKSDGTNVEVNYSPENNSANELSNFTDGHFNQDFLSLTDDNGTTPTTDFTFDSDNATTPFGGSSNPITEEGVSLVEFNDGTLPSEADYTLIQISDTDSLRMELEFVSGAGRTDIIYTLNFTSLNGGTYTGNDGSTGTFFIFLTAAL